MRRLLLAVALLGLAPAALAVPTTWPHQGRLVEATGPVDGSFSVRFALYRDASGGSPVWSETRNVEFDAGYYSVELGGTTPLPDTLTEADLFLGIRVGSGTELPRVPLGAVAFARRAAVADNVTGDISPSSITVNGTTIIDDTGAWVGPSSGLVGPQGPPGESPTPAAVAAALAAEHADTLRGPEGPQGPPGSPDDGEAILAKLAQVDGLGSGLDADRLQGLTPDEIAALVTDVDTVGGLTPEEIAALAAGIDGVDATAAIQVRATGGGTAGATRSIHVAGVNAIDFANNAGLGMVVVEREGYGLPQLVDGVTVRRNFDVNNASIGLNQWSALLDALNQLDFSEHVVILASSGPIDRHFETPINGGQTPREVLAELGADLGNYDLSDTDAFALITYPGAGRGNGLTLIADTSDGISGDLATLMLDEHVVGLQTDDLDGVFDPPGADMRVNLFPTTWKISTFADDGRADYTGSDGVTRRGLPAITKACQDEMGPGARLCSAADIRRLISVGAVNAFGQSDPSKLSFPAAPSPGYYWIDGGGASWDHGSTNPADNFGDCYHWAYRSGDDYVATVYVPPTTNQIYGYPSWARCNNTLRFLCCR